MTAPSRLATLRTTYGVARSMAIYYGKPWRYRAVERHYARFMAPGDLCFDIGAHVGNRIRAWRRLDARVVAVEPQPALAWVLESLYGRDPGVVFERLAIARRSGQTDLYLNLENPTIATASPAFIAAAKDAPTFQGQRWSASVVVETCTLDALIARHGLPRFIKLDIEGFEAEALAGLSTAVPALSFECVPMTRDVAFQCLDVVESLGVYRFNASVGESMAFVHPADLSAARMRDWLAGLADDHSAADIYASVDPVAVR